MKLVIKVTHFFDRTINLLAAIACVIILFLMLITNYEVVMRYLLGQPTIWTVEVAEYAILYLTFLGAAWVLKKGGHVANDLVVGLLNPRAQALLNFITSVIGAIICLTVTWFGITVTWEVTQLGYTSDMPLRTPLNIVLIIIPIGSFLLFIQFLRNSFNSLGKWRAS